MPVALALVGKRHGVQIALFASPVACLLGTPQSARHHPQPRRVCSWGPASDNCVYHRVHEGFLDDSAKPRLPSDGACGRAHTPRHVLVAAGKSLEAGAAPVVTRASPTTIRVRATISALGIQARSRLRNGARVHAGSRRADRRVSGLSPFGRSVRGGCGKRAEREWPMLRMTAVRPLLVGQGDRFDVLVRAQQQGRMRRRDDRRVRVAQLRLVATAIEQRIDADLEHQLRSWGRALRRADDRYGRQRRRAQQRDADATRDESVATSLTVGRDGTGRDGTGRDGTGRDGSESRGGLLLSVIS
jgi:hypothetical protein